MKKLIDATAPLPTSTTCHWKNIPWDKAIRETRRLQVRIAQACKQGCFGKVKTLQRLLRRSFYARLMAVKRVTTNKGSRTPGVDKILWKTPETKLKIAQQLGKGKYIPKPLRRIYIPKKNGKKRPLGIPTMDDRAMQALHQQTLEPIAETTADKNSYGFRPCRSTADAIEQCFIALGRKGCAQYVLEGDIKACFDEISFEWLQEHIPMDKTILKKMLNAGYMEDNIFHHTTAGTPQGGCASPTYANMALDGIENFLQETLGKRASRHKVHFVRYADDFIITADSKELLEDEIKPKLAAFLQVRGLRLSEEKTIITHIQKGFNFLGQTVRKFKNKLLIKPSDKAVKALLEKVRDICKTNKQAKTGELIGKLNPVIRGWANYHRHVVSSKIFGKVDHTIHQILVKWAIRRHPNKGKTWVRRNYFKPYKDRKEVFSGKIKKDGNTPRLFRASQIKIVRHIKVKQDANPYDPIWGPYFEKRELDKHFKGGEVVVLAQYAREMQNNLCTRCYKEIPQEKTAWELRYKTPWIYGGEPRTENIAIVHRACQSVNT